MNQVDKGGLRSTEFKVVIGLGLLMVLNGTDFVNVPWDTLTDYIYAGMAYVGGRTALKVSTKMADRISVPADAVKKPAA